MKVVDAMRLVRCHVCDGAFDLTREKLATGVGANGTVVVCEDGFSCAKRANEIREIFDRNFP